MVVVIIYFIVLVVNVKPVFVAFIVVDFFYVVFVYVANLLKVAGIISENSVPVDSCLESLD